jgi:malonate transporter MadL subunit
MKIYGVALLAGCFLVGKIMGNILGVMINIDGDIGGVGFAMILLMLTSSYMRKNGWLVVETERGILFWSSMYIPIIVAMSATSNVKAALSGGPVAVIAGISVTLICFMLVPLISKIGRTKDAQILSN